jgi:Na+/H+ antiporter NhaD/arsenite permease-like protein
MPLAESATSGTALSLWAAFPFAAFLLTMALCPLFAPGFWSGHFGKVSLAFGLPVAAWSLFHAPAELLRTAEDYVSFMFLLGSLFTISGGILLRGTIRATPGINCGFMAAGGVLANLLGTTGASMLLIRPILRANAHRKRAAHVVVFFIFIVANVGGVLTPVGDPPLFLGYLKGVPFLWTLRSLWPLWLFALAVLIGVFFSVDRWFEAKDRGAAAAAAIREPLSVAGGFNFLLLLAVIGAVFLPTPYRESLMGVASLASLRLTPGSVHDENGFTWHPIREVAVLFGAIFATMIPALLLLKNRGGELGVSLPHHFFWASGMLSSFLDNAPTYLTFFSMAQGAGDGTGVAGVPVPLLKAISAGSVFMGANSYIGNAPNFMVKTIADGAGVRMPSFFGYMAWSGAILLPTFALVTLVFF